MSRTAATIGQTLPHPRCTDSCIDYRSVIVVDCDRANELIHEFLLLLLQSQPVRSRIQQTTARQRARSSINIRAICRLPFDSTAAADQQRDRRDSSTRCRAETQRLESIYQQKLAALDALKKSLLHQAFTGQL